MWCVLQSRDRCGHCQSLAPAWKKAATALKGVVNVGAVDADTHKQLAGQYGVTGFPTIKIFGANKNKPEAYQGNYGVLTYQVSEVTPNHPTTGARSADAIISAALNAATSLVKSRTSGGGSGSSSSGSGGKKSVC